MKQHYYFTCTVNMCWFEAAFILFGQYIQSSSLYLSGYIGYDVTSQTPDSYVVFDDGWNHIVLE